MARHPAASKGSPFSIRLSYATDRFVDHEARRTHRSKSAIVEALTEEAARMRRFPGIGFRGSDSHRRAWLVAAGMDVWELIEAYEDFGSVERMRAETEVAEASIRLGLAYQREYPDEISQALAENRIAPSEARDLHPFVEYQDIDQLLTD
jgi:hypothetical protein